MNNHKFQLIESFQIHTMNYMFDTIALFKDHNNNNNEKKKNINM